MMADTDDTAALIARARAPVSDDEDDTATLIARARRSAPGGAAKLHDEYKKGLLDKRMQRENANDVEAVEADNPSLSTLVPGAIANASHGIPGAELVQAGARSLVRQQPFKQALGDIRGTTEQIPSKLSIAQHLTGAIPLAAILPGGAAAGGAALGAADAALSADDESLGMRAAKTAGGAAVGAVGGKVLQGLGNIAQRTGLTDLVGSGLTKAATAVAAKYPGLGSRAASIAEGIGTKGAGNRLLSQRQQVADEITGSEQTAAKAMQEHVESYKAQAKDLYETAKRDDQVVANPKVQQILADPRVQQMFQVARDRLGLGPNETVIQAGQKEVPRLLPGPRAPEPPAIDPGRPSSLSEAIDAFRTRSGEAARRTMPETQPQRAAREALERRTAEASLPSLPAKTTGAALVANPKPEVTEITADLPTPEELAMTKRLLSTVVQQKFGAPTGLNSAEAAQLAPLLDELRTALHEASPAWKAADQFYAQAKNFETAYQKAFGVQQKVTSTGLDLNKLKTPEALAAWANKAKGSQGIARQSGIQAGTAGRLGEALRNAPLGTDIAQTLQGANGVFQPSAAAAAVRRPGFANGEAAQGFGDLLGNLTATGQKDAARFGTTPDWKPSVNPFTLFGAGKPQNPLATPDGTALRFKLSSMLADPAQADALRAQLSQSKDGLAILRSLFTGSIAMGNGALQ